MQGLTGTRTTMSDRVPKVLKDLGQHRWRAGKAPEWAPPAPTEIQREEESMKPRLAGQVHYQYVKKNSGGKMMGQQIRLTIPLSLGPSSS